MNFPSMESLDCVRSILIEADAAADPNRTMKEANSYAFRGYNMPAIPAVAFPVNVNLFAIPLLPLSILIRTFSHNEHKKKLRREKLFLYETVIARQNAVIKLSREGGDAERMNYLGILYSCLQETVIKLQQDLGVS